MHSEQSQFDREYWENRYASESLAWSGNPNPVLVDEATPLTPGRALDIGSGEGADALWLAQHDWQVTGVDIATSALEKARTRAVSIDADAAARIDWQQHDLTEWAPQPRSFDLVSSQFMHLPEPTRTTLFRALAAAVTPGGTLLIVGHDASDVGPDSPHKGHLAELMFTAEDVVTAIAGENLRIDYAGSRKRREPATTSEQATSTEFDHDVVVLASRVEAV